VDRLESANGRLFTTQTVGHDLVGHLLGGVLYQIGRAIPLIIDAVSFAVSALLLTPPARAARRTPGWPQAGGRQAGQPPRPAGHPAERAGPGWARGCRRGAGPHGDLSLAPVVCGDARLASPEGDDG
jgi:hypothetical protein